MKVCCLVLDYTPYELMLQLLTKADDPFTGGRSYYSHPNSKEEDKPKIIHQSSATGMQAIPTTGVAQGIQYLENPPKEDFAPAQSQLSKIKKIQSWRLESPPSGVGGQL